MLLHFELLHRSRLASQRRQIASTFSYKIRVTFYVAINSFLKIYGRDNAIRFSLFTWINICDETDVVVLKPIRRFHRLSALRRLKR